MKMTMATIKKKRVSKKSKLSWRKHVNISDVEEFLEDKRLEERLGPPLATLTNDELFKLDTKPSDELQLSAKERRRLKLQRPPRCFSILQSFTKVPDPITKRNRVRTKEERKNELIKKKEEQNRAQGILKPREVQSIRDRKLHALKRQAAPKRGDFTVNIWNEEEKTDVEKDEWVSNNTKKHNLAGTGKQRKTVAQPIRPKTSVLPSLELPHPGMSYNPSFEDHQDLLKLVAEKEAAVIKEEEHLNRVTRDMFSRVTEEKRDSSWLVEMSQGLSTVKTEDSGEETDDDYKTVNPPVKNSKKTLKQKRKQKEQRQLALSRRATKLEKKKVTDIHQLKLLNKRLEERNKKLEVLREKRKKAELRKAKEAKRLSLVKFEEAELEFNMGQDLAGNLRNLKKEGSLLADRFKSLQKRNMVEPSVKRHRKRPKIKKYTKPGHKDDWITTVAR